MGVAARSTGTFTILTVIRKGRQIGGAACDTVLKRTGSTLAVSTWRTAMSTCSEGCGDSKRQRQTPEKIGNGHAAPH